jgi:hypothetical protein
MSRKINIILGSTAVILILAATGFAYYKISNRNTSDQANDTKHQAPATGEKKDAPEGQLALGFPEVLAPIGGEIDSSYVVSYPSSQQSTATFKSSKTVSAEYNSYLNYFTSNKYTILNKQSDKNSANIYAQNPEADINIVIDHPAGSPTIDIIVSYLRR